MQRKTSRCKINNAAQCIDTQPWYTVAEIMPLCIARNATCQCPHRPQRPIFARLNPLAQIRERILPSEGARWKIDVLSFFTLPMSIITAIPAVTVRMLHIMLFAAILGEIFQAKFDVIFLKRMHQRSPLPSAEARTTGADSTRIQASTCLHAVSCLQSCYAIRRHSIQGVAVE